MPWLHGTLEATVVEARHLPNATNLGTNVISSMPAQGSVASGRIRVNCLDNGQVLQGWFRVVQAA